MKRAGISDVDTELIAPFALRRLDGAVLVTNDIGSWRFMTEAELKSFVEGTLDRDGDLFADLERDGFTRSGLAPATAAPRLAARSAGLADGPWLHSLLLDAAEGCEPMDAATAERALDTAFMSPGERLVVQVVARDAWAAPEVLERIVAYAQERNAIAGKELSFTIRATPGGLTAERAQWLLANRVRLAATLSAAALMDAESPAVAALKALGQAAAEAGLTGEEPVAEAIVSVDQEALGYGGQLADAALAAGVSVLSLESPAVFPWQGLTAPADHTASQWVALFEAVLDRVLELRAGGAALIERFAAALLTRILTDLPPRDPRLRSPATDGTGQLAYTADGGIYASLEGAQLGLLGDDVFRLGTLGQDGYQDVVQCDTTRALALASALDGQPDCAQCAFRPFCGQQPVRNYGQQGSIQGRMRDSATCARHKGAQDALFTRLHRDGADAFEGWRL